jgi:hypothetical protein
MPVIKSASFLNLHLLTSHRLPTFKHGMKSIGFIILGVNVAVGMSVAMWMGIQFVASRQNRGFGVLH